MEYLEQLKKSPFFRIFTDTELETLLSRAEYSVKKYPGDALIKEEGQAVISLGIILQGSILVRKALLSGKSIEISRLSMGQTFGEAILFSQKNTYPASIVSAEDCIILYISKRSILDISQENKKFLDSFVSVLSDRIIMLNEVIRINSYSSIKEKVAYILMTKYRENSSATFKLDLSRNELAEKLNIPRPSLSRVLSQLRDEGLIEFNKNTFMILDPGSLNELLY